MASLAETIRAALAAGTLPRIDRTLYAGRSHGDHACACCGLPIRRGEIEFQPQSTPSLYAHFACFNAWRHESDRMTPDGAEPGATTPRA